MGVKVTGLDTGPGNLVGFDRPYGIYLVERADHWLFEGTGIQNGDRIKDLVGWEYHGQPVGDQESLVVLASSLTRNRPHTEIRQDPMRAHASVIYDCPKGNFVFDAGTCWWSLVLSSPPGFQNPPNRDFSEDDPRIQRVTKNLLNRMIGSSQRKSG